MSEERKYVRQVVAYANYFKEFKKTQKTPPGEIERAKRIMNEYFAQKKKGESI